MFSRAAGPQCVAGGILCLAGMWSWKCNCQTLCGGVFKADDYWLMSASTKAVCGSEAARPGYKRLSKSHLEMLRARHKCCSTPCFPPLRGGRSWAALAWSSARNQGCVHDLPSLPAPLNTPPHALSARSEPKTGFSDLNHDSA